MIAERGEVSKQQGKSIAELQLDDVEIEDGPPQESLVYQTQPPGVSLRLWLELFPFTNLLTVISWHKLFKYW